MQVYTCFKDRETLIFDDPSMQEPLFSYSEGSDLHRKTAPFWKHFLGIPQNQFVRAFVPKSARIDFLEAFLAGPRFWRVPRRRPKWQDFVFRGATVIPGKPGNRCLVPERAVDPILSWMCIIFGPLSEPDDAVICTSLCDVHDPMLVSFAIVFVFCWGSLCTGHLQIVI